MSNGNGNEVLAAILGVGGGVLLWHVLDRRKHASKPAPRPCELRLDGYGLTADGQRVTLAEAIERCKAAGSANLVAAPGTLPSTYGELAYSLGRAEVPLNVSFEDKTNHPRAGDAYGT